jgi:hypothetical protein
MANAISPLTCSACTALRGRHVMLDELCASSGLSSDGFNSEETGEPSWPFVVLKAFPQAEASGPLRPAPSLPRVASDAHRRSDNHVHHRHGRKFRRRAGCSRPPGLASGIPRKFPKASAHRTACASAIAARPRRRARPRHDIADRRVQRVESAPRIDRATMLAPTEKYQRARRILGRQDCQGKSSSPQLLDPKGSYHSHHGHFCDGHR